MIAAAATLVCVSALSCIVSRRPARSPSLLPRAAGRNGQTTKLGTGQTPEWIGLAADLTIDRVIGAPCPTQADRRHPECSPRAPAAAAVERDHNDEMAAERAPTSLWQDHDTLHGITVKAAFFNDDDGDAFAVPASVPLAERVLPFLKGARLIELCNEQDRRNMIHGDLVAQPDAVFALDDGLIAVEYKSASGRLHTVADWRREIRLKDMLQCIVAGYVVAQSTRTATACVLRYDNVAYLLSPRRAVVGTLLQLIPLARQYYAEHRRISASQIAQFAADRIRTAFPGPKDARRDQGRIAHEKLFRR